MLWKVKEPEFVNKDDRGGLLQLVSKGYNQVNYIDSKAGCIRGGHYHLKNKELFYIISGKFELILEKDQLKEMHIVSANEMFIIPPGVKHTFHYLEDTALISMYDQGVELFDGTMDMYK